MNTAMVLAIATSGLLLICLSVLVTLAYYGFIVRPSTNRRLRLQLEAQAAQGEIDRLTRSTLQEMRNAVRAEFRGSSRQGATVVSGQVIDVDPIDVMNPSDPTTRPGQR